MDDKLTRISKKVGDYFAKQFKDSDNSLFTDISETAIDGFIEEIKKDNPILASWVEDWRDKNLKDTSKKKKKESSSGTWYCPPNSGASCGMTSSYHGGGCGSSGSSSSGGCGSVTTYRGGC